MSNVDFFNTTLLESSEEVDQINKKFYGRFNYPWPPLVFPAYPADIATRFVNQDIGCWSHDRLHTKAKIWVAGCGTNQALFTALRFPEAEVFGTDLSTQSLALCKKNATQIGVKNLHLEEKSLNDITYKDEFDYIICTGVVHHNANPSSTLTKIAGALKKNGIMEFMVYNYYHRLLTTACQKAVRTFYDARNAIDLDLELKLIKSLIADFQHTGLMNTFVQEQGKMHEAAMTDNLIQPVEYSYTIESLAQLADESNLQYLQHCLNQFDVNKDAFTWNMKFTTDYLNTSYNSLSDEKRWQISNLLMFSDSPMLWFYLQRKDADHPRKSEQQICDEFLQTKFKRNAFQLNNYMLSQDGNYQLRAKAVKYPIENNLTDNLLKQIFLNASPDKKMEEVLAALDVKRDFYEINRIRIKLTTSAFPYLLSVE